MPKKNIRDRNIYCKNRRYLFIDMSLFSPNVPQSGCPHNEDDLRITKEAIEMSGYSDSVINSEQLSEDCESMRNIATGFLLLFYLQKKVYQIINIGVLLLNTKKEVWHYARPLKAQLLLKQLTLLLSSFWFVNQQPFVIYNSTYRILMRIG